MIDINLTHLTDEEVRNFKDAWMKYQSQPIIFKGSSEITFHRFKIIRRYSPSLMSHGFRIPRRPPRQ